MQRRMRDAFGAWRRVWRDRRGVTALIVALMGMALAATAALAVDVGILLSAPAALQSNTNAAVMAAAQSWVSTGSLATASATATGWHTSYPVALTSSVTADTPVFSCLSSTAGLQGCTSTRPNVISLRQTASVPTYFGRVLGIDAVTISATATAAKSGGAAKALNVMFVLDISGAMGTEADDTGCTVPGVANPTRLACALSGVQRVLRQLNPAVDQVGIMTVPGMSRIWTPCQAEPIETAYGTPGMVYQAIQAALDTDFATTPGTLNDSSAIVQAVGDGALLQGCLDAPGNATTYYAQALQQAQAALSSEGQSDAQNVIILLSSGAANADSQSMYASFATGACSPSTVCASHLAQQCNQGVFQAQQATAAGTWVFAIAYDSPTTGGASGCPSYTTGQSSSSDTEATIYDSPTGANLDVWTPCAAMQSIASDDTRFYSTTAACQFGPNQATDVATAFQQIGAALSTPRLVLLQ